MNLSKVYSTQDTFEPEDIIRVKLHEPPGFNADIADNRADTEQAKGFTPSPSPQKFPDSSINGASSDQGHKRSSDTTPERQNEAPVETQEPAPPKEIKTPPTPPPPAPGVPPEEVEQMLAGSFQKGLKEGLQQAEDDYGAATKSLMLACQQLDTLRETILKNSVGEIQDLVLAIAEKVIRHSVEEQSDTIVDTVEEAISKAVKSEEFYIYVNPEDYETVAARSEGLIAGLNGLNNIVVKKDKSIDRGGCRIESDNCTVDATLTSQLDTIRDQVKQY